MGSLNVTSWPIDSRVYCQTYSKFDCLFSALFGRTSAAMLVVVSICAFTVIASFFQVNDVHYRFVFVVLALASTISKVFY